MDIKTKLKNSQNEGVLPLTTADQVVVGDDNARLDSVLLTAGELNEVEEVGGFGFVKANYDESGDMLVVPSDSDRLQGHPASDFTPSTYTTNERRVGTWVNGKPLYRKFFEFGFTANQGVDAPHNVQNADLIWVDIGMTYFTGAWGIRQPWNTSVIYCDANFIHFTSSHPDGTVHGMLYYTKTTD